ncbi:hypothetical protein ACJ41O_006772 [Fusarium nematophilum]
MDPLSVATSIAGLLSAAGQVAKFLSPYASAIKDTPQIAARVHAEVKAISIIFSALQALTQNLASIPAERAGLIRAEQIVTVLTDGVLLFSELEEAVRLLPSQKSAGQRLGLRGRQQWARKEGDLTAFLTRLEGFKSSASLILAILNSESDRLATEQQHQLSININGLLESNRALSRRLMTLEDAFDIQSLVSKPPSVVSFVTAPMEQTGLNDSALVASADAHKAEVPGIAVGEAPNFENDLEASRVYRRTKRDSMNFSFRSSVAYTHAWSIFSGLSLSDVSVLSVIALPIYRDELSNAGHYDFASSPSPPVPETRTEEEGPILCKCLEIRLQLVQLPGFLLLLEQDNRWNDGFHALRALFRQGFPFLTLLQALGHIQRKPLLSLPWHREDVRKSRKNAVNVFLKACSEDLEVGQDNLFTESDLYHDDSAGFLKVLSLVSLILGRLAKSGTVAVPDPKPVLLSPEMGPQVESQARIEAFLADERSYVSQLETLVVIDAWVERNTDLVPAEISTVVKQLEIRLLASFHIDMLLLMEKNMLKRPCLQRWGIVFSLHSINAHREAGFIFEEERARRRIRALLDSKPHDNQEAESKLAQLLRLLPLVAGRVLRYGTLLSAVYGQKCMSREQLEDLDLAYRHRQEVCETINSKTRAYQTAEAESDMFHRVVRDRKGHDPATFGQLVFFDNLSMTERDSWPVKQASLYTHRRHHSTNRLTEFF